MCSGAAGPQTVVWVLWNYQGAEADENQKAASLPGGGSGPLARATRQKKAGAPPKKKKGKQ
jgi:hypothetical protein